ncbi:MAG: alpha/beta hydrolase [Bacteriovorax sp.]|nr:alpha/beta hydrolase [Bacteriovorax sp.]
MMKLRFFFLVLLSFFISLLLSGYSGNLSKEDIELKYAQAPSQFLVIDQTRIHYRDEGEGPTIVLIHGVLSSLHTWDGWADNLKKDHRVIRLDIPAFGLTGKFGNEQYTLLSYLSLIEHFLTKIKAPKKFILAGNSLGGFLAWNYSIVHPEQVSRLVLIDSVAYPQKFPFVLKLAISPWARYLPPYLVPNFIVRKSVESVYGDPKRIRHGVIERYSDISKYPGNHEASITIFEYMSSLSHFELETLVHLKELPMPVLIMWGEKDHWIPFNPRWIQDLPKAKTIIYPGVGHVPMEEIPEQSVADFRQWNSNLTP